MNQKLKQRKCKVCGELFTQYRSTQVVCSPQHAIEYVAMQNAKKERLDAIKQRRIYRDIKEKQKTRQEWFNEAKTIAQKYARMRDYYDGCISCNKPANANVQWHGSHFRPAGNYKSVALNLWNIHKACSECNNFKSGNLVEFQERLIKKIGQDKVDWLKSQTHPHKHSIEYLKRYKQVIGKRCRMLEKRLKSKIM